MSKPLTAIGLMSGTSLDGIDVALIETDGETVFRHGPALTVPFETDQRNLLRRALEDAKSLTSAAHRPGILPHIEDEITRWHANIVNLFLKKNNISAGNIDVIGFHGQTVIHRPDQGFTVQLGHGSALAKATGIAVVYDMRSNDMAHGGQGAPLVPAYHRAMVAGLARKPVAIVNIGGVANVTWIGADGALIAFDTGPGNALIDDWMKRHTGTARDEGGQMALVGQVDEAFVSRILADGYFSQTVPKSLDRNTFASYALHDLNVADGAATLVAVTARAIAQAQRHMPEAPTRWVICGGGRHNQAIMRTLATLLPAVEAAEALGADGDVIEAEAWAFLAVRSLKGLPLTFPHTTGVAKPVSGGVMARP